MSQILRSLAALCTLALAGCATQPITASNHYVEPLDSAQMAAVADAPPALRAASFAGVDAPDAYLCGDGARVEIAYSEARDQARVSFDGAPAVVMQRAVETGAPAYRRDNLLMRRAGARIVLASDASSVVVRSGDTLGAIALKIYGDRQLAHRIAAANADQITDANLIYPGQTLRLPAGERRCRRTMRHEASYRVTPTSDLVQRRLFSPPSEREWDNRRIRATSQDPAH